MALNWGQEGGPAKAWGLFLRYRAPSPASTHRSRAHTAEPLTEREAAVLHLLDQGVTLGEIIGVLVALLPTVGVTRVTEAAPDIFGAISRVADLPAAQRSGPG